MQQYPVATHDVMIQLIRTILKNGAIDQTSGFTLEWDNEHVDGVAVDVRLDVHVNYRTRH